MGHDVFLFPGEEGKRIMKRNDKGARGAFSQKLVDSFYKEHAKKPFDLFFAYLMDGMVETNAIDMIRKSGVPTCNFSCNNIHQFYLVDEISPHFDFNLHAERAASEFFVKVGAHPIWWPMASNPTYFKPHKLPRSIDVSFVGANYALRARYISYLLENGVDVQAFGPGWKKTARTPLRARVKRLRLLWKATVATHPDNQAHASARLSDYDFRYKITKQFDKKLHAPVTDEELISLYSKSHISLGFLEVYDRHDPSRIVTQHIHLREFEGPMCGALYCTGYIDELCEFFEPDREVLMYRNQHELLDKVNYFLTHPSEAEQIRQAGLRRALSDHTYHRRYQTLFKKIGLEK
jgi:hypothetical protein